MLILATLQEDIEADHGGAHGIPQAYTAGAWAGRTAHTQLWAIAGAQRAPCIRTGQKRVQRWQYTQGSGVLTIPGGPVSQEGRLRSGGAIRRLKDSAENGPSEQQRHSVAHQLQLRGICTLDRPKFHH